MKNFRNLILILALLSMMACNIGSGFATATAIPSSTPLPPTPTEALTPTTTPTETPVPEKVVKVQNSAASNFPPSNPPLNAADGDLETIWTSGNGPAQWILLDLGLQTTIIKIRFVVAQDQEGMTLHRLYAGGLLNDLRTIQDFSGITTDRQVIEFVPPEPLQGIQYIKVETLQSPSAVAWREIEVIGP